MIENVTGIILAGGKSSRMGKDKAFIIFGGKPLVEIIVDKLSGIFYDLMIVTNKPNLYDKYGIETQTDIKGNCGPLGGIYTGLVYSKNKYSFVIACDTPFLNQDLIKFMSTKIAGHDVVIPYYSNQLEPLYAFYSKTCIKPIKNQLQKNSFKVRDFFQHIKTRIVTEEEIVNLDPQGSCFININTSEDYQKLNR